ncbi:porin [Polynucleobacter paneuropaeus]|nr:porin [Polynucleobacter paneuropaeus]
MKKSLLALAALSAIAGAAQAQSSVTVYGILDVGYQGGNSTLTNSTTAGGTGGATVNYPKVDGALANGQVKNTQNVLGQSAEQTSRLGFKGNEDLGGGTSAFFTAEFTLTPNDQTLSGNTNGGLKNRQTFVGLKKNGLGDFAVGTQYTPIFNSAAATTAGQFNNMAGSLMYTGQADSSLGSAVNPQYGGNINAFTTRVSNALTLNTDTFAGFKGHALLVLNNTNTSEIVTAGVPTSGGNVNNNGWGLGVDYTWQKLFATASYQALKQNTTIANTSTPTSLAASAGVTAAQSQVFSNSSGTGIGVCTPTITAANALVTNYSCGNQGLNIQDNQGYVGATYDFGILKAYASFLTRKASDTQNSGVYQKRQAEEIGVRSYITPTIESWASASIGTFTPMGYNQNSVHMNAWQLGSNYYLSKRTNLYAIYGQYAQANGTYNTYSSNGNAAGTFNTNMNVNSYAVGVRHTF